jgi:hypothetical protein
VVFPPPPLVLGVFFWQRWGWRWVEGVKGGRRGHHGGRAAPTGRESGRGGQRHGKTRAVGRRGTAMANRWGVGPCEKRTRQGESIAEVVAPKKNSGSRVGRRGRARAGTGAPTPCVGRGGVGGGDGRRGGRQRGPLGRGGSTTGQEGDGAAAGRWWGCGGTVGRVGVGL